LLLILSLAAFLRLYRFDLADVINDEVFYGYRAIGLIDSLNSPLQPTPFEWSEQVPSWARLSFHDHPPLGFWIQHLFFLIFGNNLFAMRLPFVLAGLASIWLTFAIARKLFQKDGTALLSAAILAVSGYHVWISRIGLQESLVIFFILLTLWMFLKALENQKYFYWMVASTGLAMLMKYTAAVLVPIIGTYLLWKRRDLLSWKRVALSAVIIFAVLSPVIVYNVKLYQDSGHFDFQLSYLLGQDVEEWEVRPGRDVGSFADRVGNLFTGFVRNSGLVFSVFSLLALLLSWRKRGQPAVQLLWLGVLYLLFLFVAIGPQERFLAMLAPFLAILIAAALTGFVRHRRLVYVFVAVFLLAELAFGINTYLLFQPKGREGIHYSRLRLDHNAWGYNELEEYLQKEMRGFYPSPNFPLRFAFAQKLQSEAVKQATGKGLEPRAILFVTDSTIHGMSSLWYITRHTVYGGWPMIPDSVYLEAVDSDPSFFSEQGFEETVFIKAGDTLRRDDLSFEPGKRLEAQLQVLGISPETIVSKRGAESFLVYPVRNNTRGQ
jgi:hypothetical protein